MFILYCCVTLLKGSNLGLCPHKRLVITEPKKIYFSMCLNLVNGFKLHKKLIGYLFPNSKMKFCTEPHVL